MSTKHDDDRADGLLRASVDAALEVWVNGFVDGPEFLEALKDRGYTVTKMTKEEFALHVYSSTKST